VFSVGLSSSGSSCATRLTDRAGCRDCAAVLGRADASVCSTSGESFFQQEESEELIAWFRRTSSMQTRHSCSSLAGRAVDIPEAPEPLQYLLDHIQARVRR
jgi:hypothetical protein